MIRHASLAFSAPQHAAVKAHLFPGDGKEAAAILLCSRVVGTRIKLLVQEYLLVSHEDCERHQDFLSWPGDYVEQALGLADQDDLSIILLHSHPGGLFAFSQADRESDAQVMPAIFAGRAKRHKDTIWHGSAIMLEDGAMRAQLYDEHYRAMAVDMVGVYGDDLRFFWVPDRFVPTTTSRPMAFSDAMSDELGRLSVCVVGTSGTGSIVAEQVARLGFGEVILIDYDRMEKKNLNRILNSTLHDAQTRRLKVDVISEAIQSCRSQVSVKAIPTGIGCRDAILEAAMADVVFCCVDSHEGRQICDLMASAFLQPLFDVGVTIPVRQRGPDLFSILEVAGRIDYVWPGGSTLADRGVFTPSSVAAEYLARADAAVHAARVGEGYMPGSHEEAPSVISLNMRAASACVMEFIARAFQFRHDPNALRARTLFSLAACEEEYAPETDFAKAKNLTLGRGIKRPLLGLPSLEG
ncbi:ThiF family adenylyltransferase [Noviherbaspirillum sedimenti]|uniref:ThiF family adenylyltransferase n=1 Tax=Noviherbaspirillum sedimenti TaxID=2320865 RepID=A0A3A3FZ26_9BURK|nr:ThiF family adenylyltransferase [Noviherbaspirillum sedimenti]RJG00974.1 ThiF family adenylyltransferase [Noviherbaspirillum sedimenti]RJG04134.1 ThiF family adenylyltransferase [Noviherbaspirillum sedimenti]